MPKNSGLKKILVIGSGPIVIGQGCEFDYSGTGACRALRQEECFVILVNPNPATLMTDIEVADATYMEPITKEVLEQIIEKERPDALLPTMGGQLSLNCTKELARCGILEKYGVEIIGLSLHTLECTENRKLFHHTLQTLNVPVLPALFLTDLEQISSVRNLIGFPVIVRTSYTLSGYGGGFASNESELLSLCRIGLDISPEGVLIEKSIVGWKEYELEVMQDALGNRIVVCGIENVDPMGVHTGDSITVAPIQTLTDKEYQKMRSFAFAVMEAVGMTSGGCNVQFAVHPQTQEMVCIEMNPRVSRSSALASKATGVPIAKLSAKIALGYLLHELHNDLAQFSAFFEPSLDYVVVKMPSFAFDKFPQANQTLTSSMKAVGEVMAIGGNFQEALQKAIQSLEQHREGLEPIKGDGDMFIETPCPERLWLIAQCFRDNWPLHLVQEKTGWDPWFLREIQDLVHTERAIVSTPFSSLSVSQLCAWKKQGFSDKRLADLLCVQEEEIRGLRLGTLTYRRIDSCAAEFVNQTAFFYSSYAESCEARPSLRKKIIVLGSGPNRIGQGLEFDYCCVHSLKAIREAGFEAVMVNCNPSTVSTDYDVSDKLFLEPLSFEKVFDVVQHELPQGVMVQCGGQTPLHLSKRLVMHQVSLLGTSFDSIDCCEDRLQFRVLLQELGLSQPKNCSLTDLCLNKMMNGLYESPLPCTVNMESCSDDNMSRAAKDKLQSLASCTGNSSSCSGIKEIDFPVIVRPSYVIGGARMQILKSRQEFSDYIHAYASFSESLLVEQCVQEGLEVEVDAICDGSEIFICGIIEHVDPVGIHSGDSICSLSPRTLTKDLQEELKRQTILLAKRLHIIGFLNVQFCIVDQMTIFVLEVNPRASRTIPLLSKVSGLPLVHIATNCMLARSLRSQGCVNEAAHAFFGCKIPIFPFARLGIEQPILGPRMVSTGEILGIGRTHEEAFAKCISYIDDSLWPTKKAKKEFSCQKSVARYSIYRLQGAQGTGGNSDVIPKPENNIIK